MSIVSYAAVRRVLDFPTTWEVRQNQVSSRGFYTQVVPGRGAWPDLPVGFTGVHSTTVSLVVEYAPKPFWEEEAAVK
jgi:hypothetical protein